MVGTLQPDPNIPEAQAHSFLLFEEKYDVDNMFYRKLDNVSPEEMVRINRKQRQLDIAPTVEQSTSWYGSTIEDIGQVSR